MTLSRAMVNLIATVLLLTLMSTRLLGATVNDCSSQSWSICQSPFQHALVEFNLTSLALDDFIPPWNEIMLTSLCHDYREYSACLSPVIAECSPLKQVQFQGIDDAWSYLCDNSTDEFLNFSSCFRRPDVRANVSSCNATLTASVGLRFSVSDLCSGYESYISCVSSVVRSACGARAADWDNEYVTLLMTPLLSTYLSCPGWSNSTDSSSWSQASIVIASFIGVTIFVMIIIVIALVILVIHRRKQQSSTPPLSALDCPVVNINDPPSYCEPYVVYEPSSTSGPSEGDSSGEVGGQFHKVLVDPLTGMRRKAGLVDEADLPYKVSPSFPPLYADRPPPSFDESFPVGDATLLATDEVASSMAAVNEAFSADDGDDVARRQTATSLTLTEVAQSSHV